MTPIASSYSLGVFNPVICCPKVSEATADGNDSDWGGEMVPEFLLCIPEYPNLVPAPTSGSPQLPITLDPETWMPSSGPQTHTEQYICIILK